VDSTDKPTDLLRLLAHRSQQHLPTNEPGKSFLRTNKITDERIWTQYRIGAGDRSFLSDLDAASIERLKSISLVTWNNRLVLAGAGISIPTYDPREPEQPVGFVRVRAGQSRHAFATSPAGVGCPADIGDPARVILADSPLLTFQLAQAGASAVLLVEVPEVLTPLAAWLKHREIIVSSCKRAPMARLENALAELGIEAEAVSVCSDVPHTSPATLSKLGIRNVPPRDMPVTVEPPPETPVTEDRPTLLAYDERTETATFSAGDARYHVEVTLETSTRTCVRLEHAGRTALDRFDLAVEAQRRRFASSASLRTGIPAESIEEHLIPILDDARRIRTERLNPLPACRPAVILADHEKTEALVYLRRPGLLERIVADLDALGWVGESSAKAVLYMAAISRKLPEPLWAALRASPGAGKSYGLDLIAELTPPEELIQLSRLTDAALYYQDAGSLKHKLLVIDEADALTPEVIVALRVLKTRGALSLQNVRREAATGQIRTYFIEARGPVAVLTSTAGKLDAQLLSRCYDLPVDETPEQTERILAAQRQLRSTPAFEATRSKLVRLHRNVQRLLEARSVVIPFAQQIAFPATSVQHRREQQRFLALIQAVALLHQHQRLRDGDHVVADTRDFEIAVKLALPHLAGLGQGLSSHARELLDALQAEAIDTFDMLDLARLRPHWSRYAFRAVLKELLALEYVASLRSGRGRLRQFAVTPGYAPGKAATIHLRGALGELAKVGESEIANLSPDTATG
jgi:hypothetical protein